MIPIPLSIILIRVIVPLFIFPWPIWGILASELGDLADWYFIHFRGPSDYIFYQNWDKAMDLYYLTFAFIITFKWKNKLAQRVAGGLFFYRVVGDVTFWLTQKRIILFLFPNLFENFIIFYLLFVFLFRKTKLLTSWKIGGVLFVFLGIPKIILEYILHVLEKQPWQVHNIAERSGLAGGIASGINFFAQGFIFYIIPFILGLYFVRKLQRNS